MNIDPQAAQQILQSQLQPWRAAIDEPAKAQEAVLQSLSRLCRTPDPDGSGVMAIVVVPDEPVQTGDVVEVEVREQEQIDSLHLRRRQ